jgi:glycosyltransferase involved in cell wall biosynthesis
MTSIRVLHCPYCVAGNASGLARAERELGLRSWSVSFDSPRFGFLADEILFNGREIPVSQELKRWSLLWRALTQFDILHFNFGHSIMMDSFYHSEHLAGRLYSRALELRDLPLLKAAGKGIVVTFQGDDARQGDFCLAHFDITHAREVEQGYYSPESDAHKRYRIARFAEYADRMYALTPDLLNVLPSEAQFLPDSHLDLRDWRPVENTCADREIPVVVHAPTHRGVKGTRYVQDAVSRLQDEGVAFEFVLAEGIPNAEVRRIYQQADLLVDQLLVGWYGGVAVEFMALGKPVICYIRQSDLKFIPSEMRDDMPIINANPHTIYQVLKEWLTAKRNELPGLGRRSRNYVEKWHDPRKVAARLKMEYEKMCG